ncbi:MAG: NosD domain-containing protein [Bacteroidota bacterium]
MKPGFTGYFLILICLLIVCNNPADSQVRTLRMAFHIFQDDSGEGNFHRDSVSETAFLTGLSDWINSKLGNLDTLYPPVPSPYVRDAGIRIRVDTVYYHRDKRAWDCSGEIDAPYMRQRYVDQDTEMTYREKHQTLPVFIGGNHAVVGGHSRNIGDKGYIGMRGLYTQYLQLPHNEAIEECARNLLHETGHCLGLSHNFHGGTGGDQCDLCEDNGCPIEGTSNNLMDYWPNYGHALSECQVGIINSFLNGERGNISEVLINDSCYNVEGLICQVKPGTTLDIQDTVYLHGDLVIENGGKLRVTGYLSVQAERSIILNAGAVLEVDGGTIGNLCGDLWEGIRLDDAVESGKPSVAIINNGSIENTRNALSLSAATEFSLAGVVFRNNIRSLILNYSDTGHQTISDCKFETTRSLNHYEEGYRPIAGINSDGISHLEVTGCIFLNEPGSFLFHPDSSGTGIVFTGNSLEVRDNDFENLYTGILSGSDRYLAITGNRFTNNRCAVRSRSSGYQVFERNTFRLQRFNDVPTYGLVLEEPDLFRILNNRFESVYGGGQITGVFCIGPTAANSYIAGNVWSNLPLANLVLHPPAVEQNLFDWVASGKNGTEGLELGPQFRDNLYDSTGISLLIMPDISLGTGFGHPEGLCSRSGISVADWPHGGYYWYRDRMELAATGEPDSAPLSERDHGFYLFMNSEMIHPVNAHDLYEIRNTLSPLITAATDPGSFFTDDVYSALNFLEQFPALARSGRVAPLLERYSAEERAWLRNSLAEIAGRFTPADSSLTALGTMLAMMSDTSHHTITGTGQHAAIDLPGYPDLSFFRFFPPADSNQPLPGFELRPNPAGDFVYVVPLSGYVPNGTWRYELFSSDGKKIAGDRIRGWQELRISTGHLTDGVYFLRIFGSKRNLGIRRFIKISQ